MKNMLRYKTKTRPGLVALYDIRPGNGAGPFLQPRSPHGALCDQLQLIRFWLYRRRKKTLTNLPLLEGVPTHNTLRHVGSGWRTFDCNVVASRRLDSHKCKRASESSQASEPQTERIKGWFGNHQSTNFHFVCLSA